MSSRARKKQTEMNGNSLGVLSSGGLAVAERSEGERSEPQRSAATAKAGADSMPASRPDSEVVAKPKRRTYTAEYKQRILQEAEAAAATRGGLGALLRREDLRKAHIIIDVQKKVAALLGNPIPEPDPDPEEKS